MGGSIEVACMSLRFNRGVWTETDGVVYVGVRLPRVMLAAIDIGIMCSTKL